MDKLTLIIPLYKNPEYFDVCIKSAIENRIVPNTEIIAVVDGHYEEYKDIIENKGGDQISSIVFDENLGLPSALNYGVSQAIGDSIFIINEDNVLGRDWDKVIMDNCVDSDTVYTINQIEPKSGIYNFHVQNFGETYGEFNYQQFLDYEESIRENKIEGIGGEILPFVMSKKHYMTVGGWDVFYASPFVVDWDFFLKLELLGLNFVRSSHMHVYHFISKSTKNKDKADLVETMEFNNGETQAFKQFEYKWGFPAIRDPRTNSHMPKNKLIKGIKY